uniref:Phage tail protein n=1 Tax=Syphacia muris TaxID=451379 RepID=A0A0N5ACB3_9BILA
MERFTFNAGGLVLNCYTYVGSATVICTHD